LSALVSTQTQRFIHTDPSLLMLLFSLQHMNINEEHEYSLPHDAAY